ncbi:MAG: NAD-dependent epimerase/dehydratase family protein [Phycisphaeraceae bacterium]|nr:MAG: NAD-dependent epimerase/dehydratase family protein [Phycisphaeraceae bacterium]
MNPSAGERGTGHARRVLVTGGAGFVGSHLVRALAARGDRVTIVDDLSTGRRGNVAPEAEFIECSVADALSRLGGGPRFDEVYHLAASVGVDLVMRDPIGAIETNIEQTAALLRFVAAEGSGPVLITSSSEVYGKATRRVFSEDDDVTLGPTSVTRWSYACTKAIDEYLALGHHGAGSARCVIVRLFNTVGPGQVGEYGMVLPRFVRAAMRGEPLRVFGDGTQSRCFCDVRDSVRALPALLADPACHGRVFNLGSDVPVTIRELAELVRRVLGSSSEVVLVPYDKAYPAGYEDLQFRRPDLARVREAIGFEAAIGLERTIVDIAAALERQAIGGARA